MYASQGERRDGKEHSWTREEKCGWEEEVEGLPTEWNHNLLTGGWKRSAQVRCEVKAVTTRSPLLRREMIIHPLASPLLPAAPPLRGPSDVERTFPLKDVTGFIARANYDANCSNDGRQRWIIGRHLADVIPPSIRLRLTKNG